MRLTDRYCCACNEYMGTVFSDKSDGLPVISHGYHYLCAREIYLDSGFIMGLDSLVDDTEILESKEQDES